MGKNLITFLYAIKKFFKREKRECVTRFRSPFFPWFKPIRACDKQAKVFSIFWNLKDIQICKKLHGVHHAAKSDSTVCIPLQSQSAAVWCTLQSQTAHHEVEIEIFACLWLLLKGQSGEILLGVNTSIMKEKIWSINCWFSKPKILTLQCHAPAESEF